MPKKIKLDQELKKFIVENKLDYIIEADEHYGCWGKGCSHWTNWLKIFRQGEPQCRWSFEEGCSTEMIIEKLTDRLNLSPLNGR